MSAKRRTKADWWLLGLLLFSIMLAVILGLVTASGAAASPYARLVAEKGAVQWPANVTSKAGKTLGELATEAPPILRARPGKPTHGSNGDAPTMTTQHIYTIEPVGRVAVVSPNGQRTQIPILSKTQAYDNIHALKANLSATAY